MNSKSYWEKRETSKLNKGLKDCEKVDRELKKAYEIASDEVEKEIAVLYMKYAKDSSLSYLDATRYLSKSEFKNWRMSLAQYLKAIEKTGDEALLLELNTLAMKSRITRLEEMLYKINMHIDKATLMQHAKATELLENTYRESYYKTIFDIQQFKGVGSSFALIDNNLVKDILSYPWSGFDYSSRIWINRTKLKQTIQQELTQMIIQGKENREVAQAIASKMESSYSNAMRLINTEHAYFTGNATAKAYEETEVEQYEILVTLDKKTSEKCKKLDGKVFDLKNKKVWVNYPPLHVNCRSVPIPYYDDIDFKNETRTARKDEGKTYEVPASMKYEEWYKQHVNHS